MSTMNIFQKMSEVSNEIARVPKNLTVGVGKNSYKAVAEGDILKAVKEAESKFGIFSFPVSHRIVESGIKKKISTYNGETTESENTFIRVEAVYRFVNMDDPDQFVEVTAFGDGIDAQDKAPGKAVTYADKYCLMKAYKVETGNDLDQQSSDDLSGHDIWKIKQRVEQMLTEKMQHGMSQDQIIESMGLNQRSFQTCMNSFQNVAAFESKLKMVKSK